MIDPAGSSTPNTLTGPEEKISAAAAALLESFAHLITEEAANDAQDHSIGGRGAAKTLEHLRKEAHYLKDCFTRYAYQTISISAVALGFIIQFQEDNPFIGLTGLAVILLALTVGKIGIHKYADANKLHGLELFIARLGTKSSLNNNNRVTPDALKSISWEEAMRAWRIVSPSLRLRIFPKIKRRADFRNGKEDPRFTMEQDTQFPYRWREKTDKPRHWFLTKTLLQNPDIQHHKDDYLVTLFSVITIIALAGNAIFLVGLYQIGLEYDPPYLAGLPFYIILAIFGLFFVGVTVVRLLTLKNYRHRIETGIDSVHCAAIVWHMTITAHFLAVYALNRHDESRKLGKVRSYLFYTEGLSKEAEDIAKEYLNPLTPTKSVYDWIECRNDTVKYEPLTLKDINEGAERRPLVKTTAT